ncbi:MAG: zinc ribbon domain-containing protein [Patescibacteria group bacterium]
MQKETVTLQERIREVYEMLPAWQDKPLKQIVEEFISFGTETKVIPDRYKFIIKDKLISPITEKPVENSIEKSSYIGKIEAEAFEKIQDFAVNSDTGTAIWISPIIRGVHDSSKIIFSSISYEKGVKELFNCSLRIYIDENECLDLGNLIAISEGIQFNDTIELRRTPIFMDTEMALKWMESLVILEDQFEKEKKEQLFLKYNQVELMILNMPTNYNRYQQAEYLVQQGLQNGILGEAKTSCGGTIKKDNLTASEALSESSLDLNESFFECPKCHRPIPSGKGITTCPHCGAKKEDYGNCV